MTSSTKVIVVGAGPAGLMAAGQAALGGCEVVVLERMPRPARKLAITGKGRCNLTNTAEIRDFIAHFGPGGRFLRQAFARFFNTELIAFFEDNGVPLVTERGGRVFPKSSSALDIVDALVAWARHCGAHIRTGARVEEILVRDGRVSGLVVDGKRLPCSTLVLATGGASYPRTGSTGDGYRFATNLGHRVVTTRPALVPLLSEGGQAERMAGLALRNVRVRLTIDGKKRRDDFGEMEFTKNGITGPVVLTMSGEAVDALEAGQAVGVAIDLKPALDDPKLDKRLLRDFAERGKEPLSSVMRGLLPGPLVPVCLESVNLPGERLANAVTAKERRRLRTWLKNFCLDVTGHAPVDEAIVTAGGVDTREVDPKSMASKLVDGLHITGELLDLQGDTGGYNLQAAFSTGWLAGRAIAERSS